MRLEAQVNKLFIPNLKRDLIVIYVIGLLVRLAGVSWGGINEDEFINKAVRFLSGDPKPIDFFYPQLTSIISAIACGIMFLFGRFFGLIDSINELKEIYYANDEIFRVASRCAHSAIAALAGPISYLVARYFGFAYRVALIVALTTTLSPASIWFSHFAKPQNGMAVGALAATAFAIAYMNDVQQRKFAVGIGISAGVAIAFMQSAIFILIPLAVTTFVHSLTDPRAKTQNVLADSGIATAFMGGTWVVLSALDLLYFAEFLEYQVLQSQLSLRSNGDFGTLYNHAFPVAISSTQGFGPITLILAPIAAAFSRVRPIKWLSIAFMVSAFVLAWTVGDRVMPRLFLHFIIALLALSALSFASLTDQKQLFLQRVGWIGMAALLVGNCWGTALILRQAWSPSAPTLVSQALRELVTPKGPMVMASYVRETGLQPNAMAEALAYARHEQLAEKYGISIPSRSPERMEYLRAQGGGYPIIGMPWVIGGLETTKPEDVKVIKPYAWPVQPEEWDLDYWLVKGVKIYVTRNLAFYASNKATEFYRSFHQELLDRCKLANHVNADRPLFFQTDYHIFDCREAPESPTGEVLRHSLLYYPREATGQAQSPG
ncbi:MAG: hypothetical protein KTR25_17395 [Myxococcales bacterium]|nr:hypothetical protein [Myxococcales bacterium]